MLLDFLVPEIKTDETQPPKLGESLMLFIAVTLHNIPEGMAVGVAFSGALSGVIPPSEALTLSIGISVQNFPEGTIISAPLVTDGMTKRRAFLYGVLSGAVEPIAAALTVLLPPGTSRLIRCAVLSGGASLPLFLCLFPIGANGVAACITSAAAVALGIALTVAAGMQKRKQKNR